MLDDLRADLRYALRGMRRSPAFTALVVLTLAIVIAASTTIFSVASGLLLRPPDGRNPGSLVRLYYLRDGGQGSNISYADYVDLRDQSRTLDLAAFDDQRVSVTVADTTEAAFAEAVTANYFEVAGINAAIGRMLRAADGEANAQPVLVLSDRYWRRKFAADPKILGRTIAVNGIDFSVAGVAPASFHGAFGIADANLWLPVTLDRLLRPGTNQLTERGFRARGVQVLGRLRSGVTIQQARSDAAAIAAGIQQRHPQPSTQGFSVERATTLPSRIAGEAATLLGVLLMVALLLIFAAAANVANLLLARGVSAQRDVAIRQAMGASRHRVVRTLLTESLLLAVTATAGAMAITVWATRMLSGIQIPAALGVPVALDFAPDWRVLAFGVVIASVTAVLCGLAPALKQTHGHLLPLLKDASGASSARSRLRSAFVVAQVACSVVLLSVAGLFVRSVGHAGSIDLGMNTRNVLIMTVDTETRGYTEAQARQFVHDLRGRVTAMPSVEAASVVGIIPLTMNSRGIRMPGPNSSTDVPVRYNTVSPGHFATLRIPLLMGRDFDDRDAAGSRPVIIINEALATAWFGSSSPLGRIVRRGDRDPELPAADYEVIAVARNAKYASVGEAQQYFAYFPIAQAVAAAPTLMVRTAGPSTAVAAAVRRQIASLDANLPVYGIDTFANAAGVSLLPARFAAAISGALGAFIVLLASVGLYGVISFVIRQRTREIGIRMSLGASPTNVVGLFLGQALRWSALGVVIGLALALAAAQVMAGLLYGTSPVDPMTFGGVTMLLLTVTLLAGAAPVRRAVRIAPIVALRIE